MQAHRQTPTLLQMEALECGSVALTIMLRYFGYYVSQEEVRSRCKVSRDGCKAIDILIAARSYHLNANAASIDPEAAQQFEKPVILFWNFNHFIILEGFQRGKYIINDPAVGRYQLDEEEFLQGFTGLAILLKPNENFRKKQMDIKIITQRIIDFMAGPEVVLYLFLCSLAFIIPNILLATLSKVFVDDILIKNNLDWVRPLIFTLLVTALLKTALTYIQKYCLLTVGLKMVEARSKKFLSHLMHLPLIFFEQRYLGDISERIAANGRIAMNLTGEIGANFFNLTGLIFYLSIMFILSWQLSLISLVITTFNLFLLYYFSQAIATKMRQLKQQMAKLTSTETGALQSIEDIHANGLEDKYLRMWAGQHTATINLYGKILKYSQIINTLTMCLKFISMLLILLAGAILIIDSKISIGTLLAIQLLSSYYSAPLLSLINFGIRVQDILADLQRISDVENYSLDSRFLLNDQSEKKISPTNPCGITVSNLSYGYIKDNPPILNNISFSLTQHEKTAIVGLSGSGKSSLAKLLARLYEPWNGTIHMFGKKVCNLSVGELKHQIAYIDQEVYLFSGTLRDNLTLWDHTIENETLLEALRTVGIYDIVSARGGLNMQIDEAGSNLSGGQRQQIEIARALCQKPKLLILDEANSNLSSDLEQLIVQQLINMPINIIYITHQLSHADKFDNIIVIKQGDIDEIGSHENLLKNSSHYQALYLQNSPSGSTT